MANLGREVISTDSRNIDALTLPVKYEKGDDGRSYVVPIDATRTVLEAFMAGSPLAP